MNQSQGRQVRGRQTTYKRTEYIQGNAVRIADPVREMQKAPKKVNNATRKNRERIRHMNLPYVLFLSAAMMMAGMILIGYLQMQAELTRSIKHVATMESQLNDMKLSNDEELERIKSAIDIAEIKKVATQELGMTYAKEGQVVKISGEGSDYVRQFEDMPE